MDVCGRCLPVLPLTQPQFLFCFKTPLPFCYSFVRVEREWRAPETCKQKAQQHILMSYD